MRHQKKGKILDRKKAPRKALLRSLATNLVLYEKINTTEAKAKAVKPLVEKMVTKGKKGDLFARRQLMRDLYVDSAVVKMLEEIAPRYKERNGGYTRIVKLGHRQGDGAKMVRIEFV